MSCPHCGHNMLDGFKFCHHCGKSISIVTAAPELAYAPVKPKEPLAPVVEEPPEEEDAAEEAGENAYTWLSAGKVFILELLCHIPVVNFFLLAVMAASRHDGAAREYARGKLLAAMTVLILFLLAALTVVLLLAFDVIEPIYMGRWRS